MLKAGDRAKAFTLPNLQGESVSIDPSASPLTLAVIFKTNCPTCQYAWQYYERVHQAYALAGLRVIGISQHDAARTRAYRDEYGATFPHLIDKDFKVSREFDPAFVPTGFLIDSTGKIAETLQSWNSAALNTLSGHIAQRLAVPKTTIVHPQDHAVATKTG